MEHGLQLVGVLLGQSETPISPSTYTSPSPSISLHDSATLYPSFPLFRNHTALDSTKRTKQRAKKETTHPPTAYYAHPQSTMAPRLPRPFELNPDLKAALRVESFQVRQHLTSVDLHRNENKHLFSRHSTSIKKTHSILVHTFKHSSIIFINIGHVQLKGIHRKAIQWNHSDTYQGKLQHLRPKAIYPHIRKLPGGTRKAGEQDAEAHDRA